MTRCPLSTYRTLSALLGLVLFVATPGSSFGEPSPQAISAFNAYTGRVEARLAQQYSSQGAFRATAASAPEREVRLPRGEVTVERLTPATAADLPGAMLHDWRGTAFVPGATAEDFQRLMRNFNAYPQLFSPDVLQASVLAQQGNRFQVRMRIQQRQVVRVVMDTDYDVTFRPVDARRGYSISRSTRISEVEFPGTTHERTLNASEAHGLLWRLNTYWTYEQRDGGLYMQIESVSLTRSIPMGLGWAVRPLVQSVPKDSMEFTLRSICKQLRK